MLGSCKPRGACLREEVVPIRVKRCEGVTDWQFARCLTAHRLSRKCGKGWKQGRSLHSADYAPSADSG